ncbi:MAG: hypothetical protein WC503_00860 [Candidatus Shapirobacteria bacterium]
MDIKKVQNALLGLALSEHKGEVNDEIPILCEALGILCKWSDKWERYIFSWESIWYESED